MTVYLARHGETDWNRLGRWQGRTDVPLNDAGRAQADALAARLAATGIARVFTSDLLRAHETARIVAARLGLPAPDVDADLRERGFGCFEGLTREECAARFPEAWARYRLDPADRPPGAEPQEAVTARMRAAMERVGVAAAALGGAALVISHGGALRAFVGSVTGVVPPPLDNGALFEARHDLGRYETIVLLAARR